MSRMHIHTPSHMGERIADTVTAFVGSWLCIGLHALWFVVWIVLHVEPFPFGLLTMVVSLEAIFMTTLVMISQNRQADKDRMRDDLEAKEVDAMFANHELLVKMNEHQLEILERLRELQERGYTGPIREVGR